MAETVKISSGMLKTVEVFKHLTTQECESLGKVIHARKYLPNESIVLLKDDSRDVFFIISGKVRVTFYTASGKEVVFRDMSAGQMFGEISAIDGQSRSAQVEALSESIIAAASPEVFMQILRDYPDATEIILRQLTTLIRSLCDRIVEYSALSVNDRIHAELLRLAKKNLSGENSAEIHPAPTHLDIANRISTHREAVSREISELSKCGILQRKNGKLIIHDINRLETLLQDKKTEL